MLIAPDSTTTVIVLIGEFVPTAISPSWLARKALIAEEEADAADIQIIHKQLASFSLEWVTIKMQSNVLVVESTQSPWVRLQDLVVALFRDHLPNTPLLQMGINREVNFPTASVEVRDRVGRILSPLEPWGPWSKAIADSMGSSASGMTTLTMRQGGEFEDRPKGYLDVTVSASAKLPENGIRVFANDHYDVSDIEEKDRLECLMSILESNFENSIKRSDGIVEQIMLLAKDNER